MFRGRFSSTGLVGIDISGRSIKMLQLSEQPDRLAVIGAARIEPTTAGDAGEVDHDSLVEQLRSVIRAGTFTGRRCVVALPRHNVNIQSVRMPNMPEEELAQAAAWEAAQRFNMDRTKMQVDYVRTGLVTQGAENREEVLLVAAATETLNRRLDPIVEAGFRPVAVDADFAALARVFSLQCRRQEDSETVRAVLDVGFTGSTVTILRGDGIAFCKPIDIGGARFNSIVAEHLQVDEAAAAELRAARIAREASSGGIGEESASAPSFDPATDRAVYEAVRPLIGKLVKEVMLCLRYYGVTFRGKPPQTILITGGDALEPHLAPTLERTCNVHTALDDEPGTLGRLLPQIQGKLHRDPGPAACWSVAAGLSLRELVRQQRHSDAPVQGPAQEQGQAA